MSREDNVAVFRDTERLCKTNERLKASVKNATAGQKLILETDFVPEQDKERFAEPAKIVVSKKRSCEAARGYLGQKIAVHNFASASNPGGGVERGANAQEECLCRISGLFFSLNTPDMWSGFYGPHRDAHDPIHNDDIIYTPGVTVFKSDTANPILMSENEWYDVDIITCAAPNLRPQPSNKYNSGDGATSVRISDKDLLALHEKRLRRILEIAASEGVESIILGAFGCGAFQNSPEVVARAAKSVICEYRYAFSNVEFAVYCPPQDDSNYKVFNRVIGKM